MTHRREKLINAILYFAENTKLCGKTKLMKLLYFLDFTHFKQTGKSVTGLDYFAWERGPVPKVLFHEFSKPKPDLYAAIKIVPKGKLQLVVAKRRFDDQYFTPREKRILEQLAFIFVDANADQMSESTHLFNQPWHKTRTEKGESEQIDYLLAVDGKNSLPYEQAKERMEEISEMHRIFGVT